MKAKIILFSDKSGEINNFLNKFYSEAHSLDQLASWKKEFGNPVEITEFIAAFADNIHSFDLAMWVSLDKDVFIKISPANSDAIIKYLFERYPY